jgi:hypothetical protein
MQFNGINQYLDGGNNLIFERNNSFSISIWVKPTNFTGNQTMVSKIAGTRGYYLLANGGVIRLGLISGAGNFAEASFGSLTLNVWQHIVVTYNGNSNISGMTLYVDGAARSRTLIGNTLSGTIINAAATFQVARVVNSYYAGNQDELIITNTALTALQVAEVYNGGVPIDPRTLSFAANIQLYNQLGDSVTGATVNSLIGVNLTNINGATVSNDVP